MGDSFSKGARFIKEGLHDNGKRRILSGAWFDVVENYHGCHTELGMPGMREESVTSETFLKLKVSDPGCLQGDPIRLWRNVSVEK